MVLVGVGAIDRASAQSYTVTDLGSLGYYYVVPTDVSPTGQVVGYGQISIGNNRAFLWDRTTGIRRIGPDTNCQVEAVNKFGQVCGFTLGSGGRAFVWSETTGTVYLPSPGVGYGGGIPQDINDAGWVAGSFSSVSSNESVLWRNGLAIDLDGASDGSITPKLESATGVNNAGQITGHGWLRLPNNQLIHNAYLWQNGTAVLLGTLRGDDVESFGYDINDRGEIVGQSTRSNSMRSGFVWSAGTGMQELAGEDAFPRSINNLGQIVGAAVTANGWHAYLWQNRQAIDLNSMVPSNSGWELEWGHSINDRGEIVGIGRINGVSHGFILTPGAVGVKLLGARMSCLSPGQKPPCASRLGVDVSLSAPSNLPGGSYRLRLRGTLNGQPVEKAIDITALLKRGQTVELRGIANQFGNVSNPQLSIDFSDPNGDGSQADALPRFGDDLAFNLTAEVVGGTFSAVLGLDTKTIRIPLPIVFIHGYTGPPDFIRAVFGPLAIDGQRKDLFGLLYNRTSSDPFRTGYSGELDAPYRTLWFGRYNDLSGTIPMVQQSINSVVVEALASTYASRVHFITHSTGGLVARYYTTTLGQQRVRKVIMIACPNQGLSLTCLATSGFSRDEINGLLQTVAGWLLPRYQALYDVKNPCSGLPALKPALNVPPFPDLPAPPGISYISICAETLGNKGDTGWDLVASIRSWPSGDYYSSVKERVLSQADRCGFTPPAIWCTSTPSSWSQLRRGDGTVAVGNACLPGATNVKVQATMQHRDLISDVVIQQEILRALGLL
jgi:probable HAF family extracellular repeat protein